MGQLAKHARLVGADRARMAQAIAREYRMGASIRSLADTYGRSYGSVHGLLVEAGVELRSRGAHHSRGDG